MARCERYAGRGLSQNMPIVRTFLKIPCPNCRVLTREDSVFSTLGGIRMRKRYLSASLLALLGWAGLARAQVGLGMPVMAPEAGSTALAAPIPPADCRSDCPPRPNHPILGGLARTMMTPI